MIKFLQVSDTIIGHSLSQSTCLFFCLTLVPSFPLSDVGLQVSGSKSDGD